MIASRLPVALFVLVVFGACGFVLAGPVVGAWADYSNCSNEVLRTGPSAHLPDCRAYELVSPPNKNGGEVDGGMSFDFIEPSPEQASLNGEAITYGSQTTFTEADPLSSMLASQYISRRGPDGWSTQAITPTQDLPGGEVELELGWVGFSLYQGFSEDLSHAFLLSYAPALVEGAPAKYYSPYLRDDTDGSYQLLSSATPPVQPPVIATYFHGFRAFYAGMSADGDQVLFTANDALTPEAIPGENNLYEWNNGNLELVSVLPNGTPVAGSTEPSNKSLVNGPIYVEFGYPGYGVDFFQGSYRRAISADGSRVYWTYRNVASGETMIYLRETGPHGVRVVPVSALHAMDGPSPGGGAYWDASSEGKAFFTGGSGSDLYEFEPAGVGSCPVAEEEGCLTDLTFDQETDKSADVTGVLGVSENGSYVYFTATGKLTEGAQQGALNLYVWHEGSIGLIATNLSGYGWNGGYTSDTAGVDLLQTSMVSPNGRYLAFETSDSLTGYDNEQTAPGACETTVVTSKEVKWEGQGDPESRCVEVYEYDAVSGVLRCASCNSDGLPPTGSSLTPYAVHTLFSQPGWQSATVQQRYMLDDGRLFFDSWDAVLPQATNGKQNVYEYEPDGAGSCATATGCQFLISTGTSSGDSFFIDAGESGNDAFFVTSQQLVAQDGDEAQDMYDARVDGGFSPQALPPCSGEACRPPITPAPSIYGAPPSATFTGAGNLSQPAPKVAASKPKSKKQKKKKKKAKKTKARKSSGGTVRGARESKGGKGR